MAGIDNSFQSGSFGVDMAKAANLRGSGGPDRKSRRAGAPAPFFARVQDLNNAVASEDNDFNSEHSRGQSFLATQAFSKRLQQHIKQKKKSLPRSRAPLKVLRRPALGVRARTTIPVASMPNTTNFTVEPVAEFGDDNSVVGNSSMAVGTTLMEQQFKDYCFSKGYEKHEAEAELKIVKFRPSDIGNDDSFDYAIVVLLGMPQIHLDANADLKEVKIVEVARYPKESNLRVPQSENLPPSNVPKDRTKKRRKAQKVKRETDSVLRNIPKQVRTEIREIVHRLHAAGLTVTIDPLCVDGRVLIKVGAPDKRLTKEAEKVGLRMMTKDGIWRPFELRRRTAFKGTSSDPNKLFRSSQRQQLVDHILKTSKESGGVGIDDFGSMIFKKFPLHMYARTEALERRWLRFWSYGDRTQKFEWIYLLSTTPVSELVLYFGEAVGFYHAWMGSLTRWLLVPSFFGLILFALQGGRGTLDHPFVPFFCIILVVWSNLFILFWRQKSAELAHQWGVHDYENHEETIRPEFYGDTRKNEITGEDEIYYPAYKRMWKILISLLCHLCFVTASVSLLVVAFRLRDSHLAEQGNNTEMTFDSMFKSGVAVEILFVPALMAFVIPLADFGYRSIAWQLTRWENWKYESTSGMWYILKVFSFRFLNTFAYMYYYAFGNKSATSNTYLSAQLFTFILSGIFLRLFTRVAWPGLLKNLNRWRLQAGMRITLLGISAGAACCWCCCRFISSVPPPQGQGGPQKFVNESWPGYDDQTDVKASREKIKPEENNNSAAHWNYIRWKACFLGFLYRTKYWLKLVEPVHIRQMKKVDSGKDMRTVETKKSGISQAWYESHQPIVNNFEDYYSMMIMFGYVIFFSANFPLAPLLVLINNLVELRLSAYKMCSFTQRPVALRAGGIGIWFTVLQIMSVVGVLTNVAIVGFRSNQLGKWFPGLSEGEMVFVVFMFEHILLGSHYLSGLLIPPTSKFLRKSLVRERKFLLRGEHESHHIDDKKRAM